ncbi:MAG: Dabb family protein [Clostridia bacterium]|nr:Dabb family protein [Clostridia bacterium]NCC76489.1 Dabb family protein [Clostridia bacterium]
MIKHIVMWKFQEEAEGKTRQENLDFVAEALMTLRPIIPEIESMEIGQDIGVGRDTYDMVLVTTFDDAEALERYQHHPAHKAVSAYVAKVRTDRACVDFEFERF